MHLLAATPGLVLDDDRAVDLARSAADYVCLTMADTEIVGLARARAAAGIELRLANIALLKHPYSVDLFVERTLARAKAVVVRLLGGRSYWPYGIDRLVEHARATGARLALLPGDERPDVELARLSTVSSDDHARLHAYFSHGGPENYAAALASCAISPKGRRRRRCRFPWRAPGATCTPMPGRPHRSRRSCSIGRIIRPATSRRSTR
jgi:cobaltochelatase CobN